LAGTFSLDTSTGTLTATAGSTSIEVLNYIHTDYVYFAIAPGTYTNFKVYVTNGWSIDSKTKSTSVTFEAGKIYDLGTFDEEKDIELLDW